MAPVEESFVVGTSFSTSIGVADGVDDVADGVDVTDGVDGVTFAASRAAFSTLVSFCLGSYRFPVSPSYNFLAATWNSSDMLRYFFAVEQMSLQDYVDNCCKAAGGVFGWKNY